MNIVNSPPWKKPTTKYHNEQQETRKPNLPHFSCTLNNHFLLCENLSVQQKPTTVKNNPSLNESLLLPLPGLLPLHVKGLAHFKKKTTATTARSLGLQHFP
mmetsp:Transcript_25989/g.46880  ORF Transcript_25989/g.46880 Transcript_25989/m.46880 type:complete len:101 (-) Transcript_25989:196-498(-)